jgi:hypothetical protein
MPSSAIAVSTVAMKSCRAIGSSIATGSSSTSSRGRLARFSSVVLPAPFGPTSAATCPAGIASEQSRNAQVLP